MFKDTISWEATTSLSINDLFFFFCMRNWYFCTGGRSKGVTDLRKIQRQVLAQSMLLAIWKWKQSESESRSVVSDSLHPHGLYGPWNSPGQNTGVGSLSLLQGIFPTQGWNPGLPHCRRILYQLSHKWRPLATWGINKNGKAGEALWSA